MKKKHIFAILALLMTVFIFWNSARPAVESAQSSGRFVVFLDKLLLYFGVHIDYDAMQKLVRKAAHIAEFLVQSMLIAGSFSGKYRKRIVYILFFGLLTACTDEYIQLFSDGRAGLIGDIFIDFSGTAVGAAACGIFRKTGKW